MFRFYRRLALRVATILMSVVWVLLSFGGPVFAQSNLVVCAPGSLGGGGKYDPSNTSCVSGRMCRTNWYICLPGFGGGGGCMNPVYGNRCYGGRICPVGLVGCQTETGIGCARPGRCGDMNGRQLTPFFSPLAITQVDPPGETGFAGAPFVVGGSTCNGRPSLQAFQGSWKFSQYDVIWDETGRITWPSDNGRQAGGIVDACTYRGFWVEDHSDVRCETQKDGSYYWGRQHWTIIADGRMQSAWSYCDSTAMRPSTGSPLTRRQVVATGGTDLRPGLYRGEGGFDKIVLRVDGSGLSGTYSSTYSGSPGRIHLRRDATGVWRGTWSEAAVGRTGKLENITVLPDGNGFTATWRVVEPGKHGNRVLPVSSGRISARPR